MRLSDDTYRDYHAMAKARAALISDAKISPALFRWVCAVDTVIHSLIMDVDPEWLRSELKLSLEFGEAHQAQEDNR